MNKIQYFENISDILAKIFDEYLLWHVGCYVLEYIFIYYVNYVVDLKQTLLNTYILILYLTRIMSRKVI